MPATLVFSSDPADLLTCPTVVIIGRAGQLLDEQVVGLAGRAGVSRRLWQRMIKHTDPGDNGRVSITQFDGTPAKVVAGVLPEVCARHNSPTRSWAIPGLVQGAGLKGNVGILLALESPDHALACVIATARAHPTWSDTAKRIERTVKIAVLGSTSPEDLHRLELAATAQRRCAELVDRPPASLGPEAFVNEAMAVARRCGAHAHVIRGKDLQEQGLGGIWGVGKAAEEPPAMVVLDLDANAHPAGTAAATHVTGPRQVWVGKGIVYDTGGLSIKGKTSMPGMKTDMAGAAAVLTAFEAVAHLGPRTPLTAILCIAENAVGPHATRPDDVLKMYSGKTVEVNNTDAEGRLVLSDGLAWAIKHRDPAVLVDLATLTGAQSVSTGKRIAALYCSDDDLEARAVRAGRLSGDLCHPLPYVPEFFRREFTSQVADMRNSVKDRQNAQSSCAGQFIGNHVAAAGYTGPWLHVDMAGPAVSGGRGTGWGVGLLISLAS